MRRLWILITAILMVVLGASSALAHHVDDGGVDESWSEEMNQETYWESRFASDTRTAECTKWSNHNGYIPADYDAAVIKDGTMVRVYADLTEVGAFTALGAVNPANNEHFAPPHSWVMKCTFTDEEPPPVLEFTFTTEDVCAPAERQAVLTVPEYDESETGPLAAQFRVDTGEGIGRDLSPGQNEVINTGVMEGAVSFEVVVFTLGDETVLFESTVVSNPLPDEECETTTTTTVVDSTTTTVEDSTTTTVEDSTTTTVEDSTTTTVEDSTTTTVATTSTTGPPPSSTPQGAGLGLGLAALAASLGAVGGVTAFMRRRQDA